MFPPLITQVFGPKNGTCPAPMPARPPPRLSLPFFLSDGDQA